MYFWWVNRIFGWFKDFYGIYGGSSRVAYLGAPNPCAGVFSLGTVFEAAADLETE
jgi:hypothetical protein